MNFKTETELANHIKKLGGVLWLVGGCVRDELLNIRSEDRDFVITGISIDKLNLFERVVGNDFPVFLIKINNITCEVALARTEQKTSVGYRGFKFNTDKNISIEEDLIRRDLTINSIAKNVLTNEIIDPFGGINDIKNKILRHTSEAFKEDPLRVLRVARFKCRLSDFKVDSNTKVLMNSLKDELKHLTPERIWKETHKALKTDKPSLFFKCLKEVNCLDVLFEELFNLEVDDKHDGTAFNHTMNIIDFGKTDLHKFGLLVHDFGKGITPKEEHPSHHNHDNLGEDIVREFCNRLRIPNKFKIFGILCCTEHMRIKKSLVMRPGKFFKLVEKLDKYFLDVLEVSFIDSAFREGGDIKEEKTIKTKIKFLFFCVKLTKLRITGKQLIKEGKKPGVNFGELLLSRRIHEFKKMKNILTLI